VASVRKRQWQTNRGELKSGWQVDYVDQHGERQRKMFQLKKNADAFALTAQLEVREGTTSRKLTALRYSSRARIGSPRRRQKN
jgi:hypothetical protein